MLEKYRKKKKMFYDYFENSFAKNHILHAYLLETNGVSYAYNLALDLAKFLLCDGVYDENICNLIDKVNYPNLKVIGCNDKVKKSDITNLKTDFSMKSVNQNKQIYILTDVESLNKNAANSLLKFLEEPEDGVIAILLCDSAINVISTIVSRCQVISLINDDDYYCGIFAGVYDSESDIVFEDFCKQKINNFYDIYLEFENKKVGILEDVNFYDLRDELKEFLNFGYYMYYDALNYKLGRTVKIPNYLSI